MDGRFSDIFVLSGCIIVGLTSELNKNQYNIIFDILILLYFVVITNVSLLQNSFLLPFGIHCSNSVIAIDNITTHDASSTLIIAGFQSCIVVHLI